MPAPPAEPAATGNMSCPFPVSVKHIINESEQFKNSYETKHYLVITTKEKTLVSKSIAKQQNSSDVDKLEELEQ
jgi:hypothetical protein